MSAPSLRAWVYQIDRPALDLFGCCQCCRHSRNPQRPSSWASVAQSSSAKPQWNSGEMSKMPRSNLGLKGLWRMVTPLIRFKNMKNTVYTSLPSFGSQDPRRPAIYFVNPCSGATAIAAIGYRMLGPFL